MRAHRFGGTAAVLKPGNRLIRRFEPICLPAHKLPAVAPDEGLCLLQVYRTLNIACQLTISDG
jgi:hypothetical protein